MKKMLEQAGYFENRKIDTSEIQRMYNNHGYICNKEQLAFIEKYGFLEIKYNHPIWKQEVVISLNPIKAQDIISMDVVEDYEHFLDDRLLIIGNIDKENMTLFLSTKGVFYGCYDDCIIDWGNSFEEMIVKLCSGEKGKLIIMD